jgi:hypothetical protein
MHTSALWVPSCTRGNNAINVVIMMYRSTAALGAKPAELAPSQVKKLNPVMQKRLL